MDEPAPMNFIVAYLGDNDFGHSMKDALQEGFEMGLHKKFYPLMWKRYIITYVISRCMVRNAELALKDEREPWINWEKQLSRFT